MNIKGQGNRLPLVQGHSDSTFSNLFSLETAKSIEAKFHVESPLDGEMEMNANVLRHMTKMAAMPIYGKTFKNFLLWNQKSDDLETWYAALVARVLPSLFK